jgi:subtilase family serine protease
VYVHKQPTPPVLFKKLVFEDPSCMWNVYGIPEWVSCKGKVTLTFRFARLRHVVVHSHVSRGSPATSCIPLFNVRRIHIRVRCFTPWDRMVGFRKGLLITFYLVCYCKGLRENGFPILIGSPNELDSQAKFYGDILDTHVFKESIPLLSSRRDLARKDRVHHEQTHEIIFVLRQKNTDTLIRFIDDVSDPRSVNFGQHMTREEINNLTVIPEARTALLKYLFSNGAIVTSETLLSGDYIKASAAISTWERVLNTQFYTFHRILGDGRINRVVRAEKYSIPKELDEHVASVLNAIDLPARQSRDLIKKEPIPEIKTERRFRSSSNKPDGMTPAYIRSYYNLSNVYGSNLSTQAVFSFNDRYFSPQSLANFQKYFGEAIQPVASVIGGYSSDNPYNDSNDSVATIEYMSSISRGSPTIFWHSTGFSDWLLEVAAMERPPLVLVITFFQDEATTSKQEHTAFTLAAQKLAASGVTILTAAGNDGAVNQRDIASACSYRPQYPATNPYVTTVGATMVRSITTCLTFTTIFRDLFI